MNKLLNAVNAARHALEQLESEYSAAGPDKLYCGGEWSRYGLGLKERIRIAKANLGVAARAMDLECEKQGVSAPAFLQDAN